MYWVNVNENSIEISGKGVLVSGNSNANLVIFSFSSEWELLRKIAVFRSSTNMVALDVPLNCMLQVPWECCEDIGDTVYLGAYGLDEGGNIRRPTTWTTLGKIVDGVNIDSVGHSEPTKSIFVDLIEKVDSLRLDAVDSESNMDAVYLAIENLEDTMTDHRAKIDILEENSERYSHHSNLKGRDGSNQHPVSSIEGLNEAIGEDLRPEDLNELLEGETV